MTCSKLHRSRQSTRYCALLASAQLTAGVRRFEQPEVAAPVLPQNVIPLFCNGIIDLNPAPTGRARALRDVATENADHARNHMQEFVSLDILASSAELLPDLWTDFRLI